jgi:hypothetical protein
LKWVLARLSSLQAARPPSVAELESEITTRCIQFSAKRVESYTKWLLKNIKTTRCGEQSSQTAEGRLHSRPSSQVYAADRSI